MKSIALIAVPFLLAAGARQAAAQPYYVTTAPYGPAYVQAVPAPGSGAAPGALIGAGFGAAAGGPAALAGALIGAALGDAATRPPLYVAPVVYESPSSAPQAPAYSEQLRRGSADAFISNWVNFIQPSGK